MEGSAAAMPQQSTHWLNGTPDPTLGAGLLPCPGSVSGAPAPSVLAVAHPVPAPSRGRQSGRTRRAAEPYSPQRATGSRASRANGLASASPAGVAARGSTAASGEWGVGAAADTEAAAGAERATKRRRREAEAASFAAPVIPDGTEVLHVADGVVLVVRHARGKEGTRIERDRAGDAARRRSAEVSGAGAADPRAGSVDWTALLTAHALAQSAGPMPTGGTGGRGSRGTGPGAAVAGPPDLHAATPDRSAAGLRSTRDGSSLVAVPPHPAPPGSSVRGGDASAAASAPMSARRGGPGLPMGGVVISSPVCPLHMVVGRVPWADESMWANLDAMYFAGVSQAGLAAMTQCVDDSHDAAAFAGRVRREVAADAAEARQRDAAAKAKAEEATAEAARLAAAAAACAAAAAATAFAHRAAAALAASAAAEAAAEAAAAAGTVTADDPGGTDSCGVDARPSAAIAMGEVAMNGGEITAALPDDGRAAVRFQSVGAGGSASAAGLWAASAGSEGCAQQLAVAVPNLVSAARCMAGVSLGPAVKTRCSPTAIRSKKLKRLQRQLGAAAVAEMLAREEAASAAAAAAGGAGGDAGGAAAANAHAGPGNTSDDAEMGPKSAVESQGGDPAAMPTSPASGCAAAPGAASAVPALGGASFRFLRDRDASTSYRPKRQYSSSPAEAAPRRRHSAGAGPMKRRLSR
jgi:hypothetical protein